MLQLYDISHYKYTALNYAIAICDRYGGPGDTHKFIIIYRQFNTKRNFVNFARA